MPSLMPSEIVDDVRQVLLAAHRGRGCSSFLTAYQILDRLPPAIRARLISERTVGGEGAGTEYGAPSVVARAAMSIPGVQIEYMDSVGIAIQVDRRSVTPSYEVCGLYRLANIDESVI